MDLAKYAIGVLLILATGIAAANEPSLAKLLGSTDAALQTEWGQRFEHGEGVDQDFDKAVKLYCAAANQGNALAQYQLGWMYANGRGVTRDDGLAAAWFRKAASQGDRFAERMLAQVDDPKQPKKAACVLTEGQRFTVARQVAGPTPAQHEIVNWINTLAPEFGLDPKLVMAVVAMESGYRADALSPKNAQGLMQLLPATAERFQVRDVWDPQQNLRGGMAYLRWLLAYFGGNLQWALAAYNAGERAVEQYRGIPPYPETQNYVATILTSYGSDTHPPVPQVVSPSAVLAEISYRVPTDDAED